MSALVFTGLKISGVTLQKMGLSKEKVRSRFRFPKSPTSQQRPSRPSNRLNLCTMAKEGQSKKRKGIDLHHKSRLPIFILLIKQQLPCLKVKPKR